MGREAISSSEREMLINLNKISKRKQSIEKLFFIYIHQHLMIIIILMKIIVNIKMRKSSFTA